ncbi:MAG: class I SAM-dependent methyltransferase [Candidatus Bathyarchaeia archaeon]
MVRRSQFHIPSIPEFAENLLSNFSVVDDEGALVVLTSKEWHDLHASDYDASYEGKKWVEIYDRITWEKTIEPYLSCSKGMTVLDAGGGTGKWTIPIARLGYHVTLADISEKMLEMAEEKLARENLLDRVSIVPADVTNMDMFQDESFDFVLCEGDPLSYCTNPPQGIQELVRVAKKGSFIVASVDNLYPRVVWNIRQGSLDQATELLRNHWMIREFPVYFFRPSELVQEFEQSGCTVEKLVGKNMFSAGLGDLLEDPEISKQTLRLELEYCDDPYLMGLAGHISVVCRKKDE